MTAPVTKPKPDIARVARTIAELAARFPDVREDHPWGHSAFKVRGKTFLFLYADGEAISFSLKLPESGVAALSLEFAKPTEYGLGKSGWVTSSFKSARDVPLPLVKEWLTESYQAIAPKKLWQAGATGPATGAKPARTGRASKTKVSAKTTPEKPVRKPKAKRAR